MENYWYCTKVIDFSEDVKKTGKLIEFFLLTISVTNLHKGVGIKGQETLQYSMSSTTNNLFRE